MTLEIKNLVVGGILKLKNNIVFKKLQKTILKGKNDDKPRYVAKDVKKGHFVVIAEDEEETKRFIVPLRCLRNPIFMRLLEQAAEKYGFDGDRALIVPCRPNELQMLLVQQRHEEGSFCSNQVMFKCYQREPSVHFNLKQIISRGY